MVFLRNLGLVHIGTGSWKFGYFCFSAYFKAIYNLFFLGLYFMFRLDLYLTTPALYLIIKQFVSLLLMWLLWDLSKVPCLIDVVRLWLQSMKHREHKLTLCSSFGCHNRWIYCHNEVTMLTLLMQWVPKVAGQWHVVLIYLCPLFSLSCNVKFK